MIAIIHKHTAPSSADAVAYLVRHGYIKVRGHKNKLSRPYLECWLRLWITDAKGDAQGFDPVFDTYMYLLSTGQVEGKRAKLRLKFKGNEASRSMSWICTVPLRASAIAWGVNPPDDTNRPISRSCRMIPRRAAISSRLAFCDCRCFTCTRTCGVLAPSASG